MPAAAKFVARCTKRIIIYCDNKVRNVCQQVANPNPKPNPKPYLVLNLEKSWKNKFQKGFEPTIYRSAGKHANHTATEASLAMTYSIPP